MQVQINTDHNIAGGEAMTAAVTGVVVSALQRFGDQVTRVEVHLGDENGSKGGRNDKRCMMEARLQGCDPIVVSVCRR